MKRIIVPALLLSCGLFLLIGCLYIPTSETVSDPKQPDFRKLVGESTGRLIRPHYVDRRTIQLVLGTPRLFSKDRRSIGYSFQTRSGLLIVPLCFMVEREEGPTYFIRLDFDRDDILTRYQIVRAPVEDYGDNIRVTNYRNALELLNRSDPPLLLGGLDSGDIAKLRAAATQRYRSTTQPREKRNG